MDGTYLTRTSPRQVETTCGLCGHALFVRPSKFASSKHHFCNRLCYGAWVSSNGIPAHKGSKHERWKGGLAGALERAKQHVSPEGCWLWQDALNEPGYGCSSWRHTGTSAAHRAVYEHLVGPIPPGMHLDHVHDRGCRHRNCVNPDHLEPVTPEENSKRSHQSRHATASAIADKTAGE